MVDTIRKLVAIYTRVSTDKEEQKTSFKAQAEYYTKYCAEKEYELYKIYADEGITGTKKNRKDFIEMMYDAGLDIQKDTDNMITGFKPSKREPKFNYILMKDITRFSRNTNVIDIVRALVEKGVYLIFEDMNLTTDKKNWELEFNLYMTFSQQESLDKSNKLRWAYERRKENGKWHMSNPLFGYEYDEKNEEYVINEDEAVWVRKAFDMYVNELEGTKNIASHFRNNGVKTRHGKDWRADGIKRMITNEKYMGQVIIGKITNPEVTSENKTKKKVDVENWNVIEDGITPIIDKETFMKAKEILKNRVIHMADGTKKGSKKIKSIFHHKLVCSKCGSFYTRVKGTKIRNDETITEYNYFCINRRTYGVKTCDMRGVSHNVLMRELQKLIDTGIIRHLILKTSGDGDKGKEENLFEEILTKLDEQRKNSKNEMNEIQVKIDEITAKVDTLFEMFFKPNVSNNMKEATEKKIEQLTEDKKQLEIKKMGFSVAAIDQKERAIKEYYDSMVQLSNKRAYTVEELIEWIDKVEVHEGRNLHFYFKFPSLHRLKSGDIFLPEDSGLLSTRFDVHY